jgi:hypothetical protein
MPYFLRLLICFLFGIALCAKRFSSVVPTVSHFFTFMQPLFHYAGVLRYRYAPCGYEIYHINEVHLEREEKHNV